jgi:hypothetical protein
MKNLPAEIYQADIKTLSEFTEVSKRLKLDCAAFIL